MKSNKVYRIKVQLKGFLKEINRTFEVNGSFGLSYFCKEVIRSMNGDLYHLYCLNYAGQEYVDYEEDMYDNDYIQMEDMVIDDLQLVEKSKMRLEYDYGDSWEFIITVMKVLDASNNKKITLIKGKGCGIEEDCGGVWGLEKLIEDKDNEWDYDIDNFDIDEQNKRLDKRYN